MVQAEYNAGDYLQQRRQEYADDDRNEDGDIDNSDDGPMTAAEYAAEWDAFDKQLHNEQRSFVDAVCRSVELRRDNKLDPSQQLFMLTGDGGTGKTFTYNVNIIFNSLLN